jgi:hypothetical protein
MCGGFGVSGGRFRWRSLLAELGCAALLLACTGESMVIGDELSVLATIGGDATPDGGVVAAAPQEVLMLQDCPTAPGERQAVSGCWPSRHVGRYGGFFIGTPRYERLDGSGEEFPSAELELELALDGTGRLSFGGGSAIADREPCADVKAPPCASIGRLLPGFAYRLDDVALFDPKDELPRIAGEPPLHIAETMSFVIWLGQPWAAWCAAQPAPKAAACLADECTEESAEQVPAAAVTGNGDDASSSCRCSEQRCRPSAASLGIELRMSEDGRALRGAYKPSDQAFGEARLQLEREPEP